jgi:pimeloyl-ACP methyl ester carboxylesterase
MQTAGGLYYTDSLGKNARVPIVLIHGIGGSHLVWPAAMRKADNRRVIAVDLPGHGRSEGTAFRTVHQYSNELGVFLRETGIFRVILVGYSLGGQIAMQYCADHPIQCAALGIIASAPEPQVPADLLDLLNDPMADTEVSRLVKSLFFSSDHTPSQLFDLERQLFTARKGSLLCDWEAFASFSLPNPSSEKIHCPIWVCAGREDRLIPPLKSRLWAPRASLFAWDVIEHCGHGLLAERPQQVSLAFLSRLPGMG